MNGRYLQFKATTTATAAAAATTTTTTTTTNRMWANVQRDGRPAEYRWRPLFNAAKFV